MNADLPTTLAYHTPASDRHWSLADAEPGVVLRIAPAPVWKTFFADGMTVALALVLVACLVVACRWAWIGEPRMPRMRWSTVTVLALATAWVSMNAWDAARRIGHIARHGPWSPTLRLVSTRAAAHANFHTPPGEVVYVVDEVIERRGRVEWTKRRDVTLVLLLEGSRVYEIHWSWGRRELQELIAALNARLRS